MRNLSEPKLSKITNLTQCLKSSRKIEFSFNWGIKFRRNQPHKGVPPRRPQKLHGKFQWHNNKTKNRVDRSNRSKVSGGTQNCSKVNPRRISPRFFSRSVSPSYERFFPPRLFLDYYVLVVYHREGTLGRAAGDISSSLISLHTLSEDSPPCPHNVDCQSRQA